MIFGLLTILAILLTVFYGGMIILFWIGWMRRLNVPKIKREEAQVSIIIAMRNEEDNITGLIEALSAQSYPTSLFEIILVDDHSEDRTIDIATQVIASLDITARIIQLGAKETGKKAALAQGIKNSNGNLIITTDADCTMGPDWLSELVSFQINTSSDMVIAPVQFARSNNIFSQLQSLEFLALSGTTAGASNLGMPIMCNGANLLYTRKAFESVSGFDGITSMASGDDVLLMMKMKKEGLKINYIQSRSAIVETDAETNLTSFLNQRIRWASKARSYSDLSTQIVGAIILLFNLMLLSTLVLGLFDSSILLLFTLLFASKCIIDYFFLIFVTSFFKSSTYLLLLLIPEQLIYIFYVPVIGLYSLFGSYKWKGRTQI